VQFENMPPKVLRSSQSILAMDAPEHTATRKLISAAFTPKQVARIAEQITANASDIVDDIASAGEADFVGQVAAILPTRTLCDMLGVAVEDRAGVARASEVITGWNDPEVREGRERGPALFEAGMHLTTLARRLAAERRAEPRKDLITSLVQAEVGGQRLTDLEISAFFTLLCIAGTDTTRQTAAHAIAALTAFPEQREWLMADFDARIGLAIEEFVRWASPVMTFKRTCVAEFELNGTRIAPGEKVVMFYSSGNWDTDVFDHPERLDLSRSPNPHLGFGGGGAHFCLGNQVAKLQLRALLGEVLRRLPDIRAGEKELLAGNFIHGVKRLPVWFTPEAGK
jgi:cytochrome P450